MRHEYEYGKILNEQNFEEVLKHVLYAYVFREQTTRHGKALSEFTRSLQQQIGYNGVQTVTISRPSAYGEYEPYEIIGSKEEFQERVLEM